MNNDSFLSGRRDVAKEILSIIKSEKRSYTNGVYRFADDWKHNAILEIENKCNSVLEKE